MKLIINIDEKFYGDLQNRGLTGMLTAKECECMNEAIYNGTPLPKGHGRLIDADELCKGLMKRWNTANERLETLISEVMSDVVTPIVVSTPTIIEADKGE